jgi:multidrug resistance protein
MHSVHLSQSKPRWCYGKLILSPIIGYFSDRASSRKIHYLVGLLALLLSTILVAVARVYWVLLLARVLQGSSSAVVWTVGMAVLADTMPTEQLGVAMGTVGSVVSLGMVSAPVIGGAVFDKLGYEAVFWVLGGVLFVDILLRLMMIERKDAKQWDIGSGSETEDESTGLLGNSVSEFDAKSMLMMILVRSCSS